MYISREISYYPDQKSYRTSIGGSRLELIDILVHTEQAYDKG